MKPVAAADMPQVLWLVTTALVITSHPALLQAADDVSGTVSSPPPGCPTKCGDVDIPYPFGIGDNCSWPGKDYFNVTCDNSISPPTPYMGNVEIINISVETGEMWVFTQPSYICYDSENTTEPSRVSEWSINSTDSPFLISPTRNVFTAIGCNTVAFLTGRVDWSYLTGCITSCVSIDKAAKNGDTCTGLGCCQTAIPGNLSFVYVPWNYNSSNPAWSYSPCSYAFVADKYWYNFSRRDLVREGNDSFINRVGERTIPLVFDWAIRSNGSCQNGTEANGSSGERGAPACVSDHSHCVEAPQGNGYLCKCSKGYQGNPYLSGGCTNINECTDPRYSNITANGPCGMYSTCEDTDGDYICKCTALRKGNGKSENGCYGYKISPYAIAAVASFAGIVLAWVAVIVLQRRNLRKLFNKNGGKILASQGITIYTKREIDNITKGYSKRLGGGNFGDVYQGSIDGPPAQLVAVKCSVAAKVARNWQKIIQYVVPQHEQQHQQEDDGFVNEIIFQFKIRHTNVVKLIGCCLETHIPILVFELVSNGSLHDALHGTVKPCTLSLLKRLDIAIGSTEALTHMHSHGDHVHGDMKPANILLDKDLNPKVSDFGSSKLLSIDRYARAVAADTSYTDPVYMKTDRFTAKSDVYSFGIVLLELITRKTAKYDDSKSLPLEFVKCFKDKGSGRSMYDRELFSGDDAESQCNMKCLDMIGMLAVRCLKEDVEERPTMAEVLEELKQVRVIAGGGSSCSEAI